MTKNRKSDWRVPYEYGNYVISQGPSRDGLKEMLFSPKLDGGRVRLVHFTLVGAGTFIATAITTVSLVESNKSVWIIEGRGAFLGPGFRTVNFGATYDSHNRTGTFCVEGRATQTDEEVRGSD